MTEKNLTLLAGEKIVDKEGRAQLAMARRWQDLIKKLEEHDARLTALEP